ncbi:HEAT repeat domain-containing protein, partial [bacterium]|nr:HEAT repeat domain-containing protein [bacterium]
KSLYGICSYQTLEIITQLFNEASQDMKISILHLLADSPPERLKDFFISILFTYDEYISQLALKSLSHFNDENLVNVYLDCLNKTSPLIIRESILCLAKTLKNDLKMFILPFIDNSNIDIRRAALIAAGMLKISEIEEKLLGFLNQDPDNNRDCFFLIDTLSRIGGEKTLKTFIILFNSTQNANIKHWLIRGFQNFDFDNVKVLLKNSLFKYSQKMTLSALVSLLNFSSFPSEVNINNLLHDNSFEIRNVAVDIIHKFRLSKYFDSMMELYRNEFSMFIRKNIIKTIGALKIDDSIPFLMEAFNDTNWPIRKIAMSSICSIILTNDLDFNQYIKGKDFSTDQLFWIIKIYGELNQNIKYMQDMMLKHPDNCDILTACMESISKFPSSSELDDLLLPYLDHENHKIVKATVKALKNTKNIIFLDKIEKIFDNHTGEIKLWAAIALKNIGNTGTIDLLRSALKKKEVFLSRYIEQSIECISGNLGSQGVASDG